MTGPDTPRDVVRLDEIGLDGVGQAGGTGANLGELIGAGLHVPGGFVVTASAYRRAAEAPGARDRLATLRVERTRRAIAAGERRLLLDAVHLQLNVG